MSPSYPRRVAAVALTLALATMMTGTIAADDASARFTGRVLQADGATPRPGVVVTLLDVESEQTYRSVPTNDEGVFKIDSAPAGSYTLLADTSEGAFLAADGLELTAGDNRPLALTLRSEPNARMAPAQTSTGGRLPPWARYTIAGAIFVTGVVVIDEVTEDAEEPSSPPL